MEEDEYEFGAQNEINGKENDDVEREEDSDCIELEAEDYSMLKEEEEVEEEGKHQEELSEISSEENFSEEETPEPYIPQPIQATKKKDSYELQTHADCSVYPMSTNYGNEVVSAETSRSLCSREKS